mgnify:CR=1 FL=1
MITNVELLQTLYTHAMQHGMKQTETSLANATLKKFAELIVLESCKTIEREYKYSSGTPMSFWEMSQNIQDLLKQHFGVKE